MASARNTHFNKELKANAVLFKVLSHPARLVILKYLAESNICITGNDSGKIPLSQATVNQHLKKLRKAGLIQKTVNGVKVNYSLNSEKIRRVIKETNSFFTEIEGDLNNIRE